MIDLERAVGRLEGKMDGLIADVSEMKTDMKGLNSWKWKIAGGAAVLSAIVAFFMSMRNP